MIDSRGTLPLCSGCGAEHQRTGQRYCHGCHAAYMRIWNKARTAELHALRRMVGRPARASEEQSVAA